MYTADDGRKGPAPSVLVLVEGFHWGGRTQTCHALTHRMIITSVEDVGSLVQKRPGSLLLPSATMQAYAWYS